MASATIRCVEFRSIETGTLLGYADLEFIEFGFTVRECGVFHSDKGRWGAPPSRPMIDRSKQLVRDGDGKISYRKLFLFASREHRVRFNKAAITAIDNLVDGNDRATEIEVGQ